MILSKTTLAISAAAAFVGANMRFILDGRYTTKKYGQDLAGGVLGWAISVLLVWVYPAMAADTMVLIGIVVLICNITQPVLRIVLRRIETLEVSAEAVGITIVSKGREQNDTTGSSSN